MRTITLSHESGLTQWRETVRPLLAARVPSGQLNWQVGDMAQDLFSNLSQNKHDVRNTENAKLVRITKPQLELCRRVLCHTDPSRHHHLYSVLLRLQSDPFALDDPIFSSANWVRDADKSVRRDRHKMHAFVRFKKVGQRDTPTGFREVFCAWFEPDHRIVELTAGFFARRFTGMDWSILTPYGCSHWNGETLSFSKAADKSNAPTSDATEAAWTTYYSSIFNPSRVKIGAMISEMPKKYWKNLPEAKIIPQLLQQAERREARFMTKPETTPHRLTDKINPDVYAQQNTPTNITCLEDAAKAAARCTQCDLHACATQTVFGTGPARASMMIVGEQPGDQEDISGQPFTGPAGQLLDKALELGELNREELYVTNAVKHFKFKPRGKIRLHQSPSVDEIERCKSWLHIERQLVKPRIIVALGRSAIRSLTGHSGALKSIRGQVFQGAYGDMIVPTIHPSFLLRSDAARPDTPEFKHFVNDLIHAKALAKDPNIGKKIGTPSVAAI